MVVQLPIALTGCTVCVCSSVLKCSKTFRSFVSVMQLMHAFAQLFDLIIKITELFSFYFLYILDLIYFLVLCIFPDFKGPMA